LTSGFLNLNKPIGMTSHDCVGAVRRFFGIKKVGHGGTLDPNAAGVLPIAVGRATRLLPYLAPDKAYEAVIRFGQTTRTDDLEGEVISQNPVPQLGLKTVQSRLPELTGTIEQVPPAFSAIQVNGQRLYDLARRGKEVTVPSRTVTIHTLEVSDWQPGDFPELTLQIDCGPGTYIRSIARDLGDKLGCGATLASLVRTRSSGFELKNSLTLEAVKDCLARGHCPLQPVPSVLEHLPVVVLNPEQSHRWCLGQKIPPPVPLVQDVVYRVLDEQGTFLGVAQFVPSTESPILKARMVFHQP
jgi:tRNA pseudouridine55 synthase